MLENLIIKNFAIIEDIEVSFRDGMNCIVGETGAGKSIIIDALSLLKGEKSKFDKIRNGETKAFIEGSFFLDDQELINEINEEFDNLIEEDCLLHVSRTLDISNKSISKINYRSVPLSVLKRIMEQVIDIHSQHKDNSFFDEKRQITFLDKYIKKTSIKEIELVTNKYDDIFATYTSLFSEYKSEKSKLSEYLEKQDSFEDIELLQYQYEELEKANIQENEIEDIDSELKTLESFEELSNNMEIYLENYSNASNYLYACKKALNSLKVDLFNDEEEKFTSLYYELDDIHEQINKKYSSLSSSQNRLEELRERRSQLYSLRRKYGRTTEDILNYFHSLKDEIDLISNYDYIIEKQKEKISSLENKLESIASDISKIRTIASNSLSLLINEQLHDLMLENADFLIEINKTTLNKNGFDEIIFKIRANAGGKYLSLIQSASLGETSRINLALKTVFNSLKPVGTMIFDEIDTGISGKVAVGVSKKIHQISSSSQTLVITHLPQVSAKGNHHFYVSKYVEEGITKTKINELNKDEVISNIAYMMTGESPTKESLALANQLIESLK